MGAIKAPTSGYSREQIGKISVNDFSTYAAVDRKIALGGPRAFQWWQGQGQDRRVCAGCLSTSTLLSTVHQIDLQRFPTKRGCFSLKSLRSYEKVFALTPLQPLAKNSPAITSPVHNRPSAGHGVIFMPRALPDSRPGWRPPS